MWREQEKTKMDHQWTLPDTNFLKSRAMSVCDVFNPKIYTCYALKKDMIDNFFSSFSSPYLGDGTDLVKNLLQRISSFQQQVPVRVKV